MTELTPQEQEILSTIVHPTVEQIIVAPLRTQDRIIGSLCFGRSAGKKRFDIKDIDVINAIGYQTGVYVENLKSVKDIEAKIKERSKEIIEKNKELIILSTQKDEFLSYVSHELRTPLTSLVGYSKLLQSYKLPQEKQLECLGIIDKEANRLLDMINDFLDISKIEAGKLNLTFHDIDINQIINEVLPLFTQIAEAKNNTTIQNLEASQKIKADRQKLKQVIINILSNANKFTSNGNIIITTQEDQNHSIISVKDTGIGIRKEDLPRVFRKFEQIHNPEIKDKGTGLGLAISKLIVEAHKGEITCNSEFGQGSTFTIKLPK